MKTNFVRRAVVGDLNNLVQLFILYRQFYKKPSEVSKAHAYLDLRLSNQDSVVFVAENEHGNLVGFAQLYFGFSSLRMAATLTLNDLYVCEGFRRKKIASQLMEAVHIYARSTDAISIALETQVDNRKAQSLYEKFGYQVESDFLLYSFNLR